MGACVPMMGIRATVAGRVLQKWRSSPVVCRSFATRAFIVGLLLILSQPVRAADPPLPVIPSRTTNVVVSFGAKGDGTTDNAGSINAAINAVSTAGGGTVEIPTNGSNVFMSGPIIMKSSVNLHLDSGVTLKMFPMSTWVSNFGSTTFINASSLTDIEISGTGTNDGTGTINT